MVHKPRKRREPNGRASRRKAEQLEPMSSPTEVHRIRERAVREARHPELGTTLGWLFLEGKVTATQFAAGNTWVRMLRDHAVAIQAPRPPGTAQLEHSHGKPLDPDSEEGRQEARRHRQVELAYADSLRALAMTSKASRKALENVVEKNLLPAGQHELVSLGAALSTLALLWISRRQHK